MRRALFKKELRSLRPFMFVVLVIVLIDTISAFLTPFGTKATGVRFSMMADELISMQILLAFALGSNLLVREIDDGTLSFLDGLPLSRGAVFTSKVAAAMLVLVVPSIGLLLLGATVHLVTRESLDYPLHASLLLTLFGLNLIVTAVSLTAGMFLGFLRQLSWLVLAMYAIGVALLQTPAPKLSAVLNTADLLNPRFVGTSWQLPWPTIWTQLGLTLLFGVAAFALFKSSGSLVTQVQRLQKPRRRFLLPVVALMVICIVAGLVKLGPFSDSDGDGGAFVSANADAVEFLPIATGNAATTHYTFSFPALSSERVKPLIADADRIFAEVASLMDVDGGAPIDVDLSGTQENHAGTAYFERIRMQVNGASGTATLAHETAHVFALRLAGGESAVQLQGMHVFNEGLAEWIETRVQGGEARKERHELAAAIVSARRLVTPRQLTDYGEFASAVDKNLQYPLGAILIERFVRRYGAAAPKTVLLALAKEDFPRDLEGFALWQTAFQLAGYDLDLVLDDYARHLRELEPKFARDIAALPRPRGSLVIDAEEDYVVALRFDLPLPDDAYPVVRFRPGKSTNLAHYRSSPSALSPDGKYSAHVPYRVITRGEVCFQTGLVYRSITIYEPWVCLPTSTAGEG